MADMEPAQSDLASPGQPPCAVVLLSYTHAFLTMLPIVGLMALLAEQLVFFAGPARVCRAIALFLLLPHVLCIAPALWLTATMLLWHFQGSRRLLVRSIVYVVAVAVCTVGFFLDGLFAALVDS
jgi:hypothetical protein